MSRNVTLMGIIGIGVALFMLAALNEAHMVWRLYETPVPWFRDFMAQSVYEGGWPGGSDIGVTIAIFCFVVWMLRRHGTDVFNRIGSDDLKFIWQTSLITSIFTVHSLKWVVSRARPKLIFTPDFLAQEGSAQVIQNMTWSGFLPWDGPRGYSFNSFPSGHTASCAILLTIAYLFFTRKKIAGILLFVMITGYCVLMGIARSMAGMHWLSDSVASFFICWAVIHFRSTGVRARKV